MGKIIEILKNFFRRLFLRAVPKSEYKAPTIVVLREALPIESTDEEYSKALGSRCGCCCCGCMY